MASSIAGYDDFVAKLAAEFTTEEGKLFMCHFMMYVANRENRGAFAINLDDVIEWLGFTIRGNAVRLLKAKFTQDVDFSAANLSGEAVFQGGGHNKVCYMLSVNTFKGLCMVAGTDKGLQVRNYYMRMEEVLVEHILERGAAMQKAHIDDLARLEAAELGAEKMRSQGLVEGNAHTSLCYLAKASLPDGCAAQDLLKDDEFVYKFGETADIKQRVPALNADFGVTWLVVGVFKCINRELLEGHFQHHCKWAPFKFTAVINKRASTEAFKFSEHSLRSFRLAVQKEYTKAMYQGASIEQQQIAVQERALAIQERALDLQETRLASGLEERALALQENKLELLAKGFSPIELRRILEDQSAREAEPDVPTNDAPSASTSTAPTAPTAPNATVTPVVGNRDDTNGPLVFVYAPDDLSSHTRRFAGITDACREVKDASYTQIKNAARERFVYCGYRWQLVPRGTAEDALPDMPPTAERRKIRTGPVARVDDTGRVCGVENSQKAWAQKLNLTGGAISLALKRGTTAYTGGVHLICWDQVGPDAQNAWLENHTLPERRANTRSKRVQRFNASTGAKEGEPYDSLGALRQETGITTKVVKRCVAEPAYSIRGCRYLFV